MLRLLSIFVCLVFSSNVLAVNGNELFALMSDNKLASLKYVQGLMDMQTYIKYVDKEVSIASKTPYNSNFYICPPENSTYGQVYDILKKHLTDHPETRHLEASVLLFDAIGNKWPCSQ